MKPDAAALARLRQMADLVLQAESEGLRRKAEARAALHRQLQALDRALPSDATPGEMQNVLAYEGWAAARRAEINLQLALRQAEWLESLTRTRRAFGRAQVVGRLQQRD